MATPSTENLDPSGPSAASDVIKCVVMFYERGTSGNNLIRKEKFRAVLNRNYKTLSVFESFFKMIRKTLKVLYGLKRRLNVERTSAASSLVIRRLFPQR